MVPKVTRPRFVWPPAAPGAAAHLSFKQALRLASGPPRSLGCPASSPGTPSPSPLLVPPPLLQPPPVGGPGAQSWSIYTCPLGELFLSQGFKYLDMSTPSKSVVAPAPPLNSACLPPVVHIFQTQRIHTGNPDRPPPTPAPTKPALPKAKLNLAHSFHPCPLHYSFQTAAKAVLENVKSISLKILQGLLISHRENITSSQQFTGPCRI